MATALSTRVSRQLQPFFSPFRSLRDEMDDLLTRFSRNRDGGRLAGDFSPAMDLSETPDSLDVRLDVPGINPDDISIEVTGNTLKIRGERKEEKEEKGKTWHRLERRAGKFSEVVALPCNIKEDKVQAEFHDGVLTIGLPKTEEARTHTVKIKANGSGGSSK